MKQEEQKGKISRRNLLYAAIFFAILSFLLHKPFPPGFCKSAIDRAIMHIMEPGLRVTFYWPSLFLISKNSNRIWWTRNILDALHPLLGPKLDPYWTIDVETVNWAGVRSRVYTPTANSTGGAVIFIHGGGFAIGNIDIYDSLTKRLAFELNSVVVSIDYRLSPETVYPGQLNDCEGVLEHFIGIAKEKYSVDVNKIVLMGDSAGANLVAVITQRRKIKNAIPQIAGQVLLYPLLQLADLQSISYRYFYKNLNGFAIVDPESVALYYMFYAGIDMDKHKALTQIVLKNGHIHPNHTATIKKFLRYEEFHHFNYSGEILEPRAEIEAHLELQELLFPWITNPEFSPIMREDLSGLPEAFIMTCEYDVLRDEGMMYARRLEEAGVPTTFKNYENGFHAMLNFHWEIDEASRAVDDIVLWTRKILTPA